MTEQPKKGSELEVSVYGQLYMAKNLGLQITGGKKQNKKRAELFDVRVNLPVR